MLIASNRPARILWSALLACLPNLAGAALYHVDTLVDVTDSLPGDGLCLTSTGQCSLRAAIQETGFDPAIDSIMLPAGDYALSLAGANEDAGASGDLDLLGNLNLIGAEDGSSVVRSTVADRVLDVQAGANVALTRLTLRDGGSVTAGGGIRNLGVLALTSVQVRFNGSDQKPVQTGGGIFNLGALVMTGGALSDNLAQGPTAQIPGLGGGLYSTTGAVLSGVVLERNQAVGSTGSGGALNGLAPGILQLLGCTLSDNRAAFGGAIAVQGATLTITNSSLVANQATRSGAAIRLQSGELTVLNSTLSGNSAAEDGGGLLASGGVAHLYSSTLSNNQADTDANGSGNGGGLAVSGNAQVEWRHLLLAGNSDASSSTRHPDCSGAVSSLGYNLLGSASGCIVSAQTGDLFELDPRLAPLADNGGVTLTQLPLPDSPAIDAADPAGCNQPDTQALLADQRGVPRPQDGNLDGQTRCDLGAVELRPTAPDQIFAAGFE